MTLKDGLQIAIGILAGLMILVASIVVSMFFWPTGMLVPFVVLVVTGFLAWGSRRKTPSPFLNGLLIGVCISLLLCSACDVLLFRG